MSAVALEPVTPNALSNGAPAVRRYEIASQTAVAQPPTGHPVARQNFVDAMSAAVTGVNVITTDGAAGRFGLTVSAMSSVSADPPMVLACVNRRSPACNAMRANRAFCINVLSAQQRHLADTFAGRPADGEPYAFDDAIWTPGRTGVPRLVDAVSTFECVLDTTLDSGSHTIFIGRVVAASKGSANPLLYTGRAYGHPCR